MSVSVKRTGAMVVAIMMTTLLTVSYVSALSTATLKWKKVWLVSSSTSSLRTFVTTPSTGTKKWSVTGSCSLNKSKTLLVAKRSGTCSVTLRVAKKGKYKALKATKRFVIRPKSYSAPTTVPVLSPGSTTPSGGDNVETSDSNVYYLPAPFSVTLKKTLPGKTLTALSVLSDRAKFVVSNASNAALTNEYLSIDSSFNATAASLAAQTYESYLRGILSVVADAANASEFSIQSQLHSIYALDYFPTRGNALSFTINYGKTNGAPGYVTFQYDNSSKLLQAKKRYVLNTTTYTHSLDPSFTAANYFVNFSAGTYSLVASSSNATPLYFFRSPIDFDIPTSFNPDAATIVPNPRESIAAYLAEDPISAMEGQMRSGGTRDLNSRKLNDVRKAEYANQFSVAGASAITKPFADAQLLAIKRSVEANGGRLRYDLALYRNFRDQALVGTLESASIANGEVGQHIVPYIYFTNEADSSGMRHPFMVIASYSTSDKPNGLNDIRRPPGAKPTSTCSQYGCSDVTRDAVAGLVLSKVPMRDYGLVSSVEENDMPQGSLKSEARHVGASNTYNWASRGANGIAADGVLIYPALNNNLVQSQIVGEICVIGAHVGQGMGLHYHADGHRASKNGLNLYNSDDFIGKAHPPLIGFGYDGVSLFGAYEESYSSMSGIGVALDDFGGHDHDGIGYHYHAHTAVGTSAAGASFDLHILLNGAWKGKINGIPEFWPGNMNRGEPEINMGQNNKYVGRGVS